MTTEESTKTLKQDGLRSQKTLGQKIWLIIKKCIVISLGLAVNGTGLALLYSVELGSSPMATFADGLHNIIGITQGNANVLANAAFLLVLFCVARKYIAIGTVLCTFTIGVYINVAQAIINSLGLLTYPLPMKILISFMGTVLMGIGLGIYVTVDYGLGPLEALVDMIYRRTKLSYKASKTIFDATLGILGFLFGGKVGVGTIICIGFTGVIMEYSIKIAKKAKEGCTFQRMTED